LLHLQGRIESVRRGVELKCFVSKLFPEGIAELPVRLGWIFTARVQLLFQGAGFIRKGEKSLRNGQKIIAGGIFSVPVTYPRVFLVADARRRLGAARRADSY
jgi:hypothetical protein